MMGRFTWLGVIGLISVVLWLGRRIPLRGLRKWLVIGCRSAAVIALGAALTGPSVRRTREIARHVVYLVDGSASLDAEQQRWVARRLASLEALRPSQVERALVVFGSEAELVVPFGREALTDPMLVERQLAESGIDRQRTNLEVALLSAVAALPAHGRGSVVLLSDGRETAGSAAGILGVIRRMGVEVWPVPTPTPETAKTVWEELSVPPVIQRGSPIPVQLIVVNAAAEARRGELVVAIRGVPVKRQQVTVRPGWQVLTASVPAIGLGTLALDVQLTLPEEGVSETRRAYTEVQGPTRLLFVSDRATAVPRLAAALKRRDMDLAMSRLSDVPTDAHQLLDFDAVLLFQVPKSALSIEQAEALRTYVDRFGGGVVTVGLGGELAHELRQAAPLDALLPVQFEPKGLQEAKRRVCIVLLIDRSASMLGPRIAATKRAAVALVKQLAPEDLVGVLAFDTQPYVVAEVQPAGQISSWLVDKLVKLRSSGGTDVYPALAAAAGRLDLTGATLKHIILLSDGNTPWHQQAYHALVESLKRSGTTVSTIGIGAAFVNTDYLKWLAMATGGAFYSLRSLEELPQLVARDTREAVGRLPFAEGHFRPMRAPATDWFADVPEWPPLRGYLTATAKPGSMVDLTVSAGDGDEPLLARWPIGQGRVVSFTSDADTRWSPAWVRWPGFDAVWAQIIRWATRPRFTEELFVWVDESRAIPQLVLNGELDDPSAVLVDPEDVRTFPLSLVQTGTWRWHASLEHVPVGWYQLTLESRQPPDPSAQASALDSGLAAQPSDPAGPSQSVQPPSAVFTKRWVQIGAPPAEGEIQGQPPHERLLRQIAQSTAGFYDAPDRALVPPRATMSVVEPLMSSWLPVVLLLLLGEVALRGNSML